VTPVHVTHHAALRYVERVNAKLTIEEAAEAIRGHASAIEAAAKFRCCTVIMGEGGKLLLAGTRVVTVLPRSSRYMPRGLEALL